MRFADRFAFVLVRPKSPGNIGAAARAIKNMGFSDLRLVAPAVRDPQPEAAMAVHAADLLGAASTYPYLPAALADRTVVIGTTARRGPYRDAAQLLREAAAELNALGGANRVAILFGPEDFGLTNEDLKHCQRLITIPSASAYPSLNLAQAVMLVAYELRLAGLSSGESAERPEFAQAAEVDAMINRMTAALIAIGFLPENDPDRIMFAIRAIFGRSGLYPREVEILNGITRQIKWFGEGGVETVAAKRRASRPLR
jgi:tRNA/rRNA methyltransferase